MLRVARSRPVQVVVRRQRENLIFGEPRKENHQAHAQLIGGIQRVPRSTAQLRRVSVSMHKNLSHCCTVANRKPNRKKNDPELIGAVFEFAVALGKASGLKA
jgi:hypothetical protein